MFIYLIIWLVVSFSEGFVLLDPNGNITIKWDIIRWTPDGYVVSFTLNQDYFKKCVHFFFYIRKVETFVNHEERYMINHHIGAPNLSQNKTQTNLDSCYK